MTEVLAHTISMLRGRNGSNSSRNLKWDALDTLPPVCPPAYMQTTYTLCYIHTDYMYLDLHTCRLHIYTLCYIYANRRLEISLPDTYCWLVQCKCMQIAANNFQCRAKPANSSRKDARSQQFCRQCTLWPTIFNVEQKLQTAQQGWSGRLEGLGM